MGADVYWYDWKHAFNQVNINLTDPSNPMVTALLGPAIVQHISSNWRDSVSMRLGYEWLPTGRDIFRLGYVYHASPTPNSTLNPFLDGVLLNTVSVGYSRRLKSGALLNASYQFMFSPVRHAGQSSLGRRRLHQQHSAGPGPYRVAGHPGSVLKRSALQL